MVLDLVTFRRVVLATACALVLLLPASAAFGQRPTEDAYGGGGAEIVEVNGPPSAGGGAGADPTASERAVGGSLPFTGFDLGIVAVGGLALLGLGLAVRRTATS